MLTLKMPMESKNISFSLIRLNNFLKTLTDDKRLNGLMTLGVEIEEVK